MRCVKQVCAVIEVEHVVRIDSVTHHPVCTIADLAAEVVCGLEVVLVINLRAIVTLTSSLDSCGPFSLKASAQVKCVR